MKKLVTLVLVSLMAFSMVACGETKEEVKEPVAEPVSFTAGVYEGEAKGHNGNIKLEVELSESRIEDIRLLESAETGGLGDVAFNNIKEDILNRQSLNTDTVTGCTISAGAVKTAVINALTAAEADVEALKNIPFEAEKEEDKTIDTDVVVIGSGASGLLSAYEAGKNGADVVVIEKLSRNGGSTRLSSGMLVAGGTKLQEEAGIEDSTQNLIDYWTERGEGGVNQDMVNMVANNINDIMYDLMDMGVDYNKNLILFSGTATTKRAHMPTGAGVALCDTLVKTLSDMGIDVLTETKGESLIQDQNGNVVGVHATHNGNNVTINAKSVVIATGGFGWNEEMKKEYSEGAVGAWPTTAVGSTGDGLKMAMDINADTVFKGGYIGWKVVSPVYGHFSPVCKPIHGAVKLAVDMNGERFMDETSDYPFLYESIKETGDDKVYFVFDSSEKKTTNYENKTTSTLDNLELAVEAGVAFKADTIEELAKVSGLTHLPETVTEFNGFVEQGEDPQFNRNPASLKKVEEGPFYAIQVQRSILGTFGGIKTNLDTEVLDKEGNVIPGLYAAGECSNGEFFNKIYPASGSSISQCLVFGKQSGISASNYALNK